MSNSLHDAARRGDTKAALALLDDDPTLSFGKDEDNATPLHYAAQGETNRYPHSGHVVIANALIAHAADVNARDKRGSTPLFCAAGSGNTNVAEVLLARGADVNTKGYFGQTPLHLAAKMILADDNFKSLGAIMASLLIARHADVDARDNSGDTPLHYAANIGNTPVAEVLLANGANAAVKDDTGSTPLKYATNKGHSAVADLLHRAELETLILGNFIAEATDPGRKLLKRFFGFTRAK